MGKGSCVIFLSFLILVVLFSKTSPCAMSDWLESILESFLLGGFVGSFYFFS